jgi:FkbM family methyltransferase
MGNFDMKDMPLLHRFPFWYSWNGFRGSQFIWAISGLVKGQPNSKEIALPNSFPLIVDESDWISKTIYQGTYERPLLHFLNSLKLDNLVIDVGANIGVTLWHALRNSASEVKFLAFEPSKQCRSGLNLSTSTLPNQGLIHTFAIGESDGFQTMYGIENPSHSGGASFIEHAGLRGHSEEVEVRKLDSVVSDYSELQTVSLLKIDTEGYESSVIAGAHNLLLTGLVETIVMEVSPNFGDVSYLREFKELLGSDYRWFSLDEIGRFRSRFFLREISLENALARTSQWNLIVFRVDVLESYLRMNHASVGNFGRN